MKLDIGSGPETIFFNLAVLKYVRRDKIGIMRKNVLANLGGE